MNEFIASSSPKIATQPNQIWRKNSYAIQGYFLPKNTIKNASLSIQNMVRWQFKIKSSDVI